MNAARSLSIVVPAYNEERRVARLFDALDRDAASAAAAAGMKLLEVIVVDDGSTDGTGEELARFRSEGGRLRIFRTSSNRGKGAAVRAGVLAAAGTHALVTDADLSTPLSELSTLAAALDSGFDVAMGSRALPESRILIRQPRYRESLGKCFNALLRLTTDLPFRDTQCGFKLYQLDTARVLFERQRLQGFAYDAELCVLARELGVRVAEVPVSWANSPWTTVSAPATVRMAVDLARLAFRPRTAGRAP